MDNDQGLPDDLQQDLRIMSMLKSIGQAYQRGTIIVNAGARQERQQEAKAILAELARFADRVQDADRQRKTHGDGAQ